MDQDVREAARKGDVAFFESRQEALQAKEPDEDGRSLLHLASASGNTALVELISTRAGAANVNDCDDEGWTPLMSAVSAGHEAAAALLIALGADVNKSNSGGRAPLHYATSKGYLSLMRLLLKSGAKVNHKDSTGSTALHRAAAAGKAEAVRVLVEEGNARLDEEDRQGQTALELSEESDYAGIAALLKEHGAKVKEAA